MRTGWNALFKLLQQTEKMEINDLMGQLATCLQHRLDEDDSSTRCFKAVMRQVRRGLQLRGIVSAQV